MKCKLCGITGLTQNDFDDAREIVGNDYESMCPDCAIGINDANLTHDNIYKIMTTWMACAEIAELLWYVNDDEMNTVWMLHHISKNMEDLMDKIYQIRDGHWPTSTGFKIHPLPYTEGFLHGISWGNGVRREQKKCQK